jgi:dolichyl-phosphate beta-glucosyltransferase
VMTDCSIIIPAYNEEKMIGITLQSIIEQFLKDSFNFEIIVVDDGSTDQTVNIVKTIICGMKNKLSIQLIENSINIGKGHALRQGMLAAAGRICIFMDADLPFELSIIEDIYLRINSGCHIVVGSRDLPGSTLVGVPFTRFLAGQVFSFFVQLIAFRGIRDTQCGVKGFSQEAVKKIFPLSRVNDFGIDVELLFIAKKYGFVICKIPVRMSGYRGDSRIKLISDSMKMFFELIIIRYNDLLGKYSEELDK